MVFIFSFQPPYADISESHCLGRKKGFGCKKENGVISVALSSAWQQDHIRRAVLCFSNLPGIKLFSCLEFYLYWDSRKSLKGRSNEGGLSFCYHLATNSSFLLDLISPDPILEIYQA